MPSARLRSRERAFFDRVARAVFTNPFGEEWEEIDRRPVRASIEKLEREHAADLALYGGEDAEALTYAFLFDAYYRFRDDFDRLIGEQLSAGDEPCAVPFARDVLELLGRRGFEPERARFHLALFFQLHRAFYFIDRALVGTSTCMRMLRRDLWNNIFTGDLRRYIDYLSSRMEDFSTLLLGETGTGKGSAAAAIGRSGFIPLDREGDRFVESFTRAFVDLNLSQFPESLIESELFGHERGAFTGAVDRHDGVFATCSPHGSIFLDEIGDISVPVQVKLLRVLQERTFTSLGSRDVRRFHGRVIAATNRSMDELRERGAVRDDFFYRLCSDVIVVPPLRQRLQEAPAELEKLVNHVMTRLLGVKAPELVEDVCATIGSQLGPGYSWPGNVRELEQCVRRILLKGSYEGDSLRTVGREPWGSELADLAEGRLDARQLLAAYCSFLYRRHGTYEKVARLTRLDRRTVRKYVSQAQKS
ncbi:MAG: sigma 54-interacting transcriptional regulator [Planctomycetota bacterium]|nr:sigma 54-interacting transcriptional regulator [Planctomycetota bacterium]